MFVDTLIIKYLMLEGVNVVRQNRSNEHSAIVEEKIKDLQKRLTRLEIAEGKVYAINNTHFNIETTLGRAISIKKNNDMSIKLYQEIRVIFNPITYEYFCHEGHTNRK